jgi:hypothetical protein
MRARLELVVQFLSKETRVIATHVSFHSFSENERHKRRNERISFDSLSFSVIEYLWLKENIFRERWLAFPHQINDCLQEQQGMSKEVKEKNNLSSQFFYVSLNRKTTDLLIERNQLWTRDLNYVSLFLRKLIERIIPKDRRSITSWSRISIMNRKTLQNRVFLW